MSRSVVVTRSTIWIAITVAVAVAFVAIAAFIRDLILHDWRYWAIVARAMVWAGSLVIVLMLIAYDLLDSIIDPFIDADWPIAVVAILLIFGLQSILSALVSDEE